MTKKESGADASLHLKAQIKELQTQCKIAEEGKLRALADLENVRRREGQSRANWSQDAIAEWVRGLLPSIQELLLGAEHTKDEDIQKVIEKFMKQLETQGVQKINPQKGDEINPEEHAVLMTAEGKPGTVVEVLEPGWKLRNTVLVPAKISGAPLL